MKPIKAYGQATVRLTDAKTGRVDKEITARNKINLDYAAEIKNSLFNPSSSLIVYLSDYDQPPVSNGFIFPMGKFLGLGKYNVTTMTDYQGCWSSLLSVVNKQEKGLTYSTFVWDFVDAQAVGTLRSLFLYWEGTVASRYPAIIPPANASWSGNPRWSVENKLLDVVGKTATSYTVTDFYTKQCANRVKMNTLTLSGIARDVDSGHIFIFDAADKKLYEFASLDVDMTAPNVIAEYPCTKAFFGKGLIKGGNLFYLSGNADPTNADAANPTGAELFVFQYPYKTDGVPVQIDKLSCIEAGIAKLQAADMCAFIDDYLIHHNAVSGNIPAPILKVVGNTVKAGFTGVSYTTTTANNLIQRPSPNRQILMAGLQTSSIVKIPPMAVSHLLLPTPIVKTDKQRLAVSYTISIQD